MTTETTTAEPTTQEAAAPAAPVVDTRPPPKSDAEAAIREQEDAAAAAAREPKGKAAATATGDAADDGADPDAEKAPADGKKPNRTTEYINRLQTRIRDLEARVAPAPQPSQDARTATQQPSQATPAASAATAGDDPEPTLEDSFYDLEDYTRKHSQWAIRDARRAEAAEAAATQQRESQTKLLTTYNERVAAFEAEHPDFKEAIVTMPYELSDEVGLAILAHEDGPAIAYYAANNPDAAFLLANAQPRNAAAAVELIRSRMDAAQQASQDPPAAPAAGATPATPAAKQISQAPAPTPKVGGRSAVQVPAEKQTDDDWYRADKERRRKR